MTWSVVGQGSNTGGPSTTLDITLSVAPSAGDSIFVQAGTSTDNSGVLSVVLDPAGVNQPFTARVHRDGLGEPVPNSAWDLLSVNAGAGVTVRITWGNSTITHGNALIMRASTQPPIFDGSENANGAAGTSSDSGAGVTPTGTDNLLVGALQTDGNHGGVTPGGDGQGGTYSESTETTRSELMYETVGDALQRDAKASWVNALDWVQILTVYKIVPPPPPAGARRGGLLTRGVGS